METAYQLLQIITLTNEQVDAIAMARAVRGAKKLDEFNGTNWREMLRKAGKLFDISRGDYCVLGIRFGDYEAGMAALTSQDMDGDPEAHGFESDEYIPYEALQKAWCKLVGIKQTEPSEDFHVLHKEMQDKYVEEEGDDDTYDDDYGEGDGY